jgi:UDP-N-acetylmuramoyl-tripeptide--D-alanyl-D-alanine ligase
MRARGQIAELTAIAQPQIGVIVNVAPVHLEVLGSLEEVAGAKAELIHGLPVGGTIILPANEPLLDSYRRSDLTTVTFGEGGDVSIACSEGSELTVNYMGNLLELELPFSQRYRQELTLAAVAAAGAVGITPAGSVNVRFTALRSERVQLPNDVVVINDCYNAHPISMRAALDELSQSAGGRRIAVLGDMRELGPRELEYHSEIGSYVAGSGVDLLITVGALAKQMAAVFSGESLQVDDATQAASLLSQLLQSGDTVLIKGSRSLGLEVIAESLLSGVAS